MPIKSTHTQLTIDILNTEDTFILKHSHANMSLFMRKLDMCILAPWLLAINIV